MLHQRQNKCLHRLTYTSNIPPGHIFLEKKANGKWHVLLEFPFIGCIVHRTQTQQIILFKVGIIKQDEVFILTQSAYDTAESVPDWVSCCQYPVNPTFKV